jgi:hypothetical protein
MKNNLILVLLVILIIPAIAGAGPVEKGNFVISLPVLSFQSQGQELYETPNGEDRTTITIGACGYELGIQYFIISGLALGGGFGISALQIDDDTTETISIEPMVSYYLSLGSILPYVGVDCSYKINSFDVGSTNTTNTNSSIIMKAGAAFMLGNKIAAYADASYDQEEYTPDGETATSGNTIIFALSFKAFFNHH